MQTCFTSNWECALLLLLLLLLLQVASRQALTASCVATTNAI
jgi:hypothetical protein